MFYRIMLAFLIMILFSCTSVVEENDVSLVDGQMLLKKNNSPYSGRVVARFENGKEASRVTFKNGYRLGVWYIKGLADEIVQEGEYISCPTELKTFIKRNFGDENCSISLWNEDSSSFATLYITDRNNRGINDSDGQLIFDTFLKKYRSDIGEIYVFRKDSVIFHDIYYSGVLKNSGK